jgi:hypothetical protein
MRTLSYGNKKKGKGSLNFIDRELKGKRAE